MTENAAVGKLKEKFSGSVLDVTEFRGETTVTVKKEDIVAICAFAKKELGYNLLSDVCGVDYLGRAPRFMVVYHLFNISTKERLRLKAPVEEKDPRIDTVSGIWATANWHERECWDLMGIVFNNHPDLRRILMPDDWEGHPLRKDYPLQGPDREPYQGRLS
ncbi:NADH-quinone oxidoreductase subunit C [Desulfuromonas sp. TF]|uniref:NADH-quinone oxidoreductase subunit C n=1 Tax=Desulfuromonas sp. TF TaxID=1232410 RepID=UPI000400251C|nr:NADH-quinone oxidoreductase subunit C [Desulfuromonas sp. TF]